MGREVDFVRDLWTISLFFSFVSFFCFIFPEKIFRGLNISAWENLLNCHWLLSWPYLSLPEHRGSPCKKPTALPILPFQHIVKKKCSLLTKNRKGWLKGNFFPQVPVASLLYEGWETDSSFTVYTHGGAPICQIISQCRRTKVFICPNFIHHCLSTSLHCHGSSELQQVETDNEKSKQAESMRHCVNPTKILQWEYRPK